jgi:hypothetical protein
MEKTRLHWCRFDWHTEALACSLARLSDGIRIAISRAMIAMTTNSSMRVKAFRLSVIHLLYLKKEHLLCNLSEFILPLLSNALNAKKIESSKTLFVFAVCHFRF